MSFADDIALKRTETAQQQRDKHTQALNESIASNTSSTASHDDIDSLINQVKEVQLATLLGNGKPTVILTDQTDLGDKIDALATKLADTVQGLDSGTADSAQLTELKALKSALIQLSSSLQKQSDSEQKANTALLKAVKAIELSPAITVPAPTVTVKAPKVDLTPLRSVLQEYLPKSSQPIEESESDLFDLDDYKAQDIDNSVKDMQYIGFVNPTGAWYIIENDVKGNKLRYVFGTDDYSAAFARASEYQYQLLNEAIHALSA